MVVFKDAQSAGQKLKMMREAQGLTAESVELQLCLQPGYIEAMEAARWVDLPSPVFLKGYLGAYCKLLNSDVSQYLPAFERAWSECGSDVSQSVVTEGGGEPVRPLKLAVSPDYEGLDLRGHVALFSLMLVFIGGVLYWDGVTAYIDQMQARSMARTMLLEGGVKRPELGSDVAVVSRDDAAFERRLDLLLGAEAEFAIESESAAQKVVLTELGRPNTWLVGQASAGGQDALELYFLRQTRVEIIDSQGQKGAEADNEYASGALLKFGGRAPFTLMIEDPSAVMVKFNQQPIDFITEKAPVIEKTSVTEKVSGSHSKARPIVERGAGRE